MTNMILELGHGVLALLGLEFVIILLAYMFRQSEDYELGWKDFLLAAPLGVTVALALFTNRLGELGRTGTIWFWRVTTEGKTPLGDFNLGMLSAFTLVAAVGLLFMIRAFSRPIYGEWPWLACLATTIIFSLATVYLK